MNQFDGGIEQDGDGTDPALRLLLVRGVTRSFPWVLLLIFLGAAVGLGVGLSRSNRYVSNAKLSLRMGSREQLTPESLVDFDARQNAPPPTMVDELQMLADTAIFEGVARELGSRFLLEPADPQRNDGPLTPVLIRQLHRLQGWVQLRVGGAGPDPSKDDLRLAATLLKENTIVFTEPGSSVIVVSHTSTSPEKARTTLQALTSAFIARHRQQYSLVSLLQKSRGQLEEARVARDTAASAFVEQMGQSGIVELERQVPLLETEVSAIESELFAVRLRHEEIGRLQISLSNRLKGIPAEVEIERPALMVPNDEYDTQLALRRTLLLEKQTMLIQDRPSEETRRREQNYDIQLAKIDEKLAQTPKVVVRGSDMQENLGHSALESRIVDLEVEDEALPVKVGLLESRLDAKKADLSAVQRLLLAATLERKDLGASRDAQESRYTRLADQVAVLEALENIDANEGTNLRVLQAPTLEPEKVGPRRATLLVEGVLAGTLAALAFALLRQRFDRRLRYPEVFEHSRDVPVLCVVPRLASLRRLKRLASVRGR